MNDLPRQILCEIIRQNGKTYFEEKDYKLRNLLNDLCYGDCKKERRCITDSISEGIPSSLLDRNEQIPYDILSAQLTDRLINCGFDRQLARWTVDSWAQALGIISQSPLNVGSLSVVANPSEAKIFLNDKLMGISPLEISTLLAGKYDLKISLDGCETWQKRIEIPAGQKISINANLIKTASYGEIFINSSPEDAVIFIDSQHHGATPNIIRNIPVGVHQISLVLPGYEKFSENISIHPGKNADLKEKLIPIGPPPTGQIVIDSVPSNAEIYLDAIYQGKTPKILNELSIGSHYIGIKLPGYHDYSTKTLIHQGKNQDIFLKLTKKPQEGHPPWIILLGLVIAIVAIYYGAGFIPAILSFIFSLFNGGSGYPPGVTLTPTPTTIATPRTTLVVGTLLPETAIISGFGTSTYYFDVDNAEKINFIRIWVDGAEFSDYDFIIGKDHVPSFSSPQRGDIVEDIGLRTEQYDLDSPTNGRYYIVVKNKGSNGSFKISRTVFYK